MVELLIVMIVIGILAAIAVPVYLDQRRSAVDASIRADLRLVALVAEAAYARDDAYPAVRTLVSGATTFAETPVTVSPGNVLEYGPIGSGGFCITGTNPASHATPGSTTVAITYNSLDGGLGSSACP